LLSSASVVDQVLALFTFAYGCCNLSAASIYYIESFSFVSCSSSNNPSPHVFLQFVKAVRVHQFMLRVSEELRADITVSRKQSRNITSQQNRGNPRAVAATGGEVTAATIRRPNGRRPRLCACSRSEVMAMRCSCRPPHAGGDEGQPASSR